MCRILVILSAAIVLLGALWLRHLDTTHQHCIKQAGIAFRLYAEDHHGALPFHTNGFGDALLLLVKGDYLPDVHTICGPGDDGRVLSTCVRSGSNVEESKCSRVYVQGLHSSDSGAICILFDRRSVPGGDHRYGWGPLLREVCLLDGTMQSITDGQWPAFVAEQLRLLVNAGIKSDVARSLYADSSSPP